MSHEENVAALAGEVEVSPPTDTATAAPWPTLDPAALHGLAGDVVRHLEPQTESDPVAILVQLLVGMGNACGRGPFFQVESSEHHLNEFALLVGRTARARKGTAWDRSRALLDRADPLWAARRVGGLSSGEGVIHAVRDPSYRQAPVKEGKQVVRYEAQLEDAGVEDKRLLVVESELGGALRTMKRDSNTLSAVLRQAWDGTALRVLTKNSPATATDPHISIVGHITEEELKRELDRVELANGFLNRFLVVCVRRSKELPDGGHIDPAWLDAAAGALGAVIDFGRRQGQMQRSHDAAALWPAMYSRLTAERPGLLGAVTARAEAHVVRLSALYALLDRAPRVAPCHMEAAEALWRYCEDSVRYLFGDSTGDPVADHIHRALSATPDGLTRTAIRDLFQKNRTKEEIDRALAALAKYGLAARSDGRGEAGGRPVERWVRSFTSFMSSPTSHSLEQENGKHASLQDNDINDITPIKTYRHNPSGVAGNDINDFNDITPAPGEEHGLDPLPDEYLASLLADPDGEPAEYGPDE